MLPSLSTTTLPWHGPITDLPSGPRPQPGTVSNVMRPHPIRTGSVFSAASAGRAANPRARVKASKVERFFTDGSPELGNCVADAGRTRRDYQSGPRRRSVRPSRKPPDVPGAFPMVDESSLPYCGDEIDGYRATISTGLKPRFWRFHLHD